MKLSDLKTGDMVDIDAGFTCMNAGQHIVRKSRRGFYLNCDEGHHYLDGQEDLESGELVGIKRPQDKWPGSAKDWPKNGTRLPI